MILATDPVWSEVAIVAIMFGFFAFIMWLAASR